MGLGIWGFSGGWMLVVGGLSWLESQGTPRLSHVAAPGTGALRKDFLMAERFFLEIAFSFCSNELAARVMKSAGLIAEPERLSPSQRTALLSLLSDDDPVIYRTVRFFFQAEDGIRDWSVTGVQRVLFR